MHNFIILLIGACCSTNDISDVDTQMLSRDELHMDSLNQSSIRSYDEYNVIHTSKRKNESCQDSDSKIPKIEEKVDYLITCQITGLAFNSLIFLTNELSNYTQEGNLNKSIQEIYRLIYLKMSNKNYNLSASLSELALNPNLLTSSRFQLLIECCKMYSELHDITSLKDLIKKYYEFTDKVLSQLKKSERDIKFVNFWEGQILNPSNLKIYEDKVLLEMLKKHENNILKIIQNCI